MDRSYLSIREVLDLLVGEFPDVTISKIRFLESRGLIHPERTPSGYRKFYEHDVERLRWILRQQREHFLPLKVIKGRLENSPAPSLFDTDALIGEAAPEGPEARLVPSAPVAGPTGGSEPDPADGPPAPAGNRQPPRRVAATIPPGAPAAPAAPLVPADAGIPSSGPAPVAVAGPVKDVAGPPAQPASIPAAAVAAPPAPVSVLARTAAPLAGLCFSAEELSSACGADVGLVDELEEFGLVTGRTVAGVRVYDEDDLTVVRVAASLRRFGIEARHLRMFKHAAEREAGLYTQVVTPLLRQRNPAARERAERELSELTGLGAELQGLFVRAVLRDLTGG